MANLCNKFLSTKKNKLIEAALIEDTKIFTPILAISQAQIPALASITSFTNELS